VEIAESARKHRISDRDIEHAVKHPVRIVPRDNNYADRLLVIGPDTTGRLLEVVVVPADDPQRVIHADVLRSKFYDYL
jgi:uncharacterized DUF497 family protein